MIAYAWTGRVSILTVLVKTRPSIGDMDEYFVRRSTCSELEKAKETIIIGHDVEAPRD